MGWKRAKFKSLYMNLLNIISKRRSVREYLHKEIEQEKIDYIIECARLAPSAVNYQPWKFIIIKSEDKKQLLHKCYNHREWFKSAPLYIIGLGDANQSWKRKSDNKDHLDIDLTIAMEHIVLAAEEQGLGTCWVCNFDVALYRQLFNIPENLIPVGILPIGYPAKEMEKVSNRKTVEEICETV
jgi:nitroreductase